MNESTSTQHLQKITRIGTTLCLMLLLGMLVMMNQILYGPNQNDTQIGSIELCSEELSQDLDYSNPAGPDEKVPENTSSFSEEYLHEQEDMSAYWKVFTSKQRPSEEVHHYAHFLTQFTPPPELTTV